MNQTIIGRKDSKNNTKIRVEGVQGRGRLRIKWEEHMRKETRKRDDLAGGEGHESIFVIYKVQPDATVFLFYYSILYMFRASPILRST